MSEHPGVVQLRQGFEAYEKGNMHALSELFADDIEWIVPGANALAGTYHGKIEMFSFFSNIIRESKGSWRNELIDVLANGRHAVALLKTTAKKPDVTVDVTGAAIFTLKPDGKIGRAVFLYEDQAQLDRFFASAAG